MKLKRTVIASLLAAVGFGGAAVAYDRWTDAPHGEMRWHHASGHASGFDRWCADGRERRFDNLVAYAEGRLKPTAEQAERWAALIVSLREGAATLAAACHDLGASDHSMPGSQMARAQTTMATGLAVLQRVRPDVEALYATLTAAQRSAFLELMGWNSL